MSKLFGPNETAIKQYRLLAKSYDKRYKRYIESVNNRVIKTISVTEGSRVLDVGCGTGEVMLRLLESQPKIELLAGVDVSPDMLELAKQKLAKHKNVLLHVAGAELLPYGDNSFDAVYSSGVMHYVNNPRDAIREIKRVIKPGGQFLLIDVAAESLIAKLPKPFRQKLDSGTVRFYSLPEAVAMLTESGFKIVSSELFSGRYIGLKLYVVHAVQPMARKIEQ